MNIFYAMALGLHSLLRSGAANREDKATTVCADCEAENYAEAACCKQCGRDYLIPRAEFRTLKEAAAEKRHAWQEAADDLHGLRGMRECPRCDGQYGADHAHCTACGTATVPLNGKRVFAHMRKLHKGLVHVPEDLNALAATPASSGFGDWVRSLFS